MNLYSNLDLDLLESMSASELERRTFHECACAMVGRAFGASCKPSFKRTQSPLPESDRFWDATVLYPPFHFTPRQRRQFAISGWVALWFFDECGVECSAYACPEEAPYKDFRTSIEESSDPTVWSLTDWESVQGWVEEDLRFVYEFIQRNWDSIKAEAKRSYFEALESDACGTAALKVRPRRKTKKR